MADGIELDESQRAVLALALDADAVIVGAPGSGKTTTLVEFAADRVEHHDIHPDQLLVVASERRSASALRDRLGRRLGVVTNGPLARTAASIAFEAATQLARSEGAPQPRLLSGSDHDVIIRELLAGQATDGLGPSWPESLDPVVRGLPAFRTELRDFLVRLTEYDITPERLRELGREHDRADWLAVADFAVGYRDVIATTAPGALDAAELAAFGRRAIIDGLAGERLSGVRVVLVDELQQATEGVVRLLRAFADRGATIVAFGDPDIASNAFRGGEADVVSTFATRMGRPVGRLELARVHRHGPALRAVISDITGRVGAAGQGTQRAATSTGADDVAPIRALTAASPSALASSVARMLRERHLRDGVPWSQMAIVLRSSRSIPALSRTLALAQVPTRTTTGGTAIRDNSAAAALLQVVAVGTGRMPLTPEIAEQLLTGPYGGLDTVGVRRLRMDLRASELGIGGVRLGGTLLAEALADPLWLETLDHQKGKRAARLARVLTTVREQSGAGASAEELLWTAWDGSRTIDGRRPATVWREQSLQTGILADEANRALDGVLGLFTSARRFAERRPELTAADYLDAVLDAEIPEDTLAPQSDGEAVLVTTSAGVVAIEFDTVVVSGLQEGQWPNLRPRGSLLGAPALVDTLAGVDLAAIDDRRRVLADELRLLALAASRARVRLVAAAIAGEDEAPSPFFALIARHAPAIEDDDVASAPYTLRGLTGELRRAASRGGSRSDAAVAGLRRLADEGVPGADPASWRGALAPSTDLPLVDLADPEARVPVSPSKLSTIERSPLEAFAEQMAGGSKKVATNVGTLVHHAMETASDVSETALWTALEERWGELIFDSEWIAERETRSARRAIRALAEYLGDIAAKGVVLVSAEPSFEIDVAPAVLSGKIDRVESLDGEIVIVDLKTGRPESDAAAQEHPQLGAYQLAYAQGAITGLPDGHRSGGARLLFTREGLRKALYTLRSQAAFGEEQLEAFRERVRDAAVAMAGPRFDAVVIDDPFAYGSELRRILLPDEVSSD